jgi:hypothetical protein
MDTEHLVVKQCDVQPRWNIAPIEERNPIFEQGFDRRARRRYVDRGLGVRASNPSHCFPERRRISVLIAHYSSVKPASTGRIDMSSLGGRESLG